MTVRVDWDRRDSVKLGSRARVLFVDRRARGVVYPSGERWFAFLYGVEESQPQPQPRRGVAKRWLLARAAGLPDVPRWPKVKTVSGYPNARVVARSSFDTRPPPGWRILRMLRSTYQVALVRAWPSGQRGHVLRKKNRHGYFTQQKIKQYKRLAAASASRL